MTTRVLAALRPLLLAPSFVFALAAGAPAQSVSAYVIVDLTANPKDPDATQIVSFDAATVTGGGAVDCNKLASSYAIGQLAGLVTCAAADSTPVVNRIALASHIKATAKAAAQAGTTRFITTKGDQVRVVVIDRAEGLFAIKTPDVPSRVRGKVPAVTFKETERETQLVTDLRSLAQVAGGILGAESAVDAGKVAGLTIKPVAWAYVSTHGLTKTRAVTSVAAESGKVSSVLVRLSGETAEEAMQLFKAVEDEQAQQAECKAPATPFLVLICKARGTDPADERIVAIEGLGTLGDARATPTLVALTAPASESRIRSAALTALAKLKPAAAPAAAAAGDVAKPSTELITGPKEHWFLSADVPVTDAKAFSYDKDTNQVTFGDEPSTFYLGINFLIGDLKDPKRSLADNVVIKAMLKASNRPLDSYGVAVGLRGQYLSKWGLNLDALTPFVGLTFTQEDAEDNGVVTRRVRRNSEFRFGVSLNLDQAVKWVGGKK